MAISIASAAVDALRYGAFLVEGRFTLYQNGLPTSYVLPISTMSVTVDRNSNQRRSGNITAVIEPSIPPPEILPTTPNSILSPFGPEVFVETGIATADGVLAWVPIGLFAIATTTVSDVTTDLVISLQLYDRSWVISQRSFLKAYNFPAASGNFVDEIQTLLTSVWADTQPPLQFNIVPTSATVPTATYNQGQDPWAAALQMAAAVGYELFFDINGVVTGLPIPDPTTQAITWNFTDDPTLLFGNPAGSGSSSLGGSPYSSPAEAVVTFTRDRIYNDVFVTGTGTQNAPGSASGSTAPVLAQAQDLNPLSATYVDGPMGNVPEFISTNIVTSDSQAQVMANNELAAALSAAWQVTVNGPPNPIFDIDDVCTLTRPRLGINNLKFVIDTITHKISYADLMSVTGRVVPTP